MLSNYELIRKWIVQLSAGSAPDPKPANDEQQALLEGVVRDLKEAKAKGQSVHIADD